MSDVAATNCGCDCGCGCQSGGNGCNIIWLILILCCCGGGNGVAAVLEITAAGNGCGADIIWTCCFYAAVAAAMAASADLPQKVRKQRAFMRPCFHFGKTPFSSFRSSPLLFPAL